MDRNNERFQKTGLVTLSRTEPFFTVLKVCFWAAIIASIPIWLYQVYAFIIRRSGPVAQEDAAGRRGRVVSVPGGVAFGFFFVLLVALQFLLDFGGNTFQTRVRAGEYFSFALMLGPCLRSRASA